MIHLIKRKDGSHQKYSSGDDLHYYYKKSYRAFTRNIAPAADGTYQLSENVLEWFEEKIKQEGPFIAVLIEGGIFKVQNVEICIRKTLNYFKVKPFYQEYEQIVFQFKSTSVHDTFITKVISPHYHLSQHLDPLSKWKLKAYWKEDFEISTFPWCLKRMKMY